MSIGTCTSSFPPPLSSLPTDPVAVLQLVRSKGKSKVKLVPTRSGHHTFAPIYGITSVLMLAQVSIDRFAAPLYRELAAMDELRHVVLLLPPSSYHVTLRGLEDALATTTVDALRHAEIAYRATFFQELTPAPIGEVEQPDSPKTSTVKSLGAHPECSLVLEDPMYSSAAVLLVSPEGLLAEQLVMSQEATAHHLGLSKDFVQEYHISVGYFVTSDVDKQRAAQRVILNEARKLLLGARIQLDAPHVCWYDTMERFITVFPLTL